MYSLLVKEALEATKLSSTDLAMQDCVLREDNGLSKVLVLVRGVAQMENKSWKELMFCGHYGFYSSTYIQPHDFTCS